MAKHLSKKAFLARMAKGRAAAARKGNPKRHTRRKRTSRKRNLLTVSKSHRRRSRNPRKAFSMMKRRGNPDMEVGGVEVKPAIVQGLGVAVGAYLGMSVTDFIGSALISRLPTSMQGIGYALGGIGELVFGEWVQRRMKNLPVLATAAAMSVPMWIRVFESFGFGQSASVSGSVGGVEVGDGTAAGRRRRMMRGSIQQGRLPGGMTGTIQTGRIPAGMMGRGHFGGLIN
jgi:hypothetical protein